MDTQSSPIHRILYLSHLSPGLDDCVFGDICRTVRRRNAELKIGAVLLFDGQRFCQLLTGAPDATHTLLHRIRNDSRHRHLDVLAQSGVQSPAARPVVLTGRIEPELLDALVAPALKVGDDAFAVFDALLAQAQLDSWPPRG